MTTSSIRILTPRLALVQPPPEDAARAVRFVTQNRDHLAPWDPVRGAEYFTEDHWRETLEDNRRAAAAGLSLRTFITPRDGVADAPEGDLIGCVNVNLIQRGAFHCGTLGYSIGRDHEGRGLMREALEGMIAHAFKPRCCVDGDGGGLGLHRLQANYQPHNVRSAAVLERLGFTNEGFAKEYLFLHGGWRDHVLTSLTNRDWVPEHS